MGERGGGRFGGRREGMGRASFDGGRKAPLPTQSRNMVWQRPDPPPPVSGSSNPSGSERNRWEMAAARAQGGKSKEWAASSAAPAGGGATTTPSTASAPSTKSNAGDLCHNCSLPGHFAPRCPTVRCEKCGKLGHMAQLCQTLRPWECIPYLCGFQSPGQGFFYIPDMCAAKNSSEKTNSVVITIVEGEATTKEIETEFNGFFAHKPEKKRWRCTARPINSKQFVMRFPNAREVETACCYGKRLPLKDGSAIVSITPWSASVGAKGEMQKAWVRVSNIPLEKRCPEHISFAGGLVGLTLEVDAATLHKPEYTRILLGCRDVEKIPPCAEGMLGEQLYDFFYEVERIVVGGHGKNQSSVVVDSSSSPTFPKRARCESYTGQHTGHGETSASVVGNSSSQTYDKSSRHLNTISETEEDEESEEENHTELLIETLARESQNKLSPMVSTSSEGSPVGVDTGIPSNTPSGCIVDMDKDYVVWPALPKVVELEEGAYEGGVGQSDYTVESPTGSPIHESMCSDVPKAATRTQYQKLPRVEEQAVNLLKKRNLEGLLKEGDKVEFQAGVKRLARVAAGLADGQHARGRLLLGDGDGIRSS